MTDPSLAEVTHSPHHLHTCRVLARMFDDTVTSLHHALLLATFGTLWKTLDRLTEIAECAVFLSSFTLVALHSEVARLFYNRHVILPSFLNFLLSQFHLIVFLSSPRLFLRHSLL